MSQHRGEAVPEVVEDTKLDIAKCPVFADIAEMRFIRTSLIDYLPVSLPSLRCTFCGSLSAFTSGGKNTFYADLAHLRVLVIPLPLSPVMPHQKCWTVLDFVAEFPIFQPDFKNPKIQDDVEGIPTLGHLKDHNRYLPQIQTNDS